MKLRHSPWFIFCLFAFGPCGCSYRLPVASAPTMEGIHLIGIDPQLAILRVEARSVADLRVPLDGRVRFTIPSRRASCGVYLFNAVKVGGGVDPARSWRVLVIRNGKTLRTLSLKQIRDLPLDDSGYHVLRI